MMIDDYRNKLRGAISLTAAAGCVVLLGARSSSGSGGSGTAGGGSSGAKTTATGAPIVMGSLQTLSGPLGTAAAGDPTLISNWVQDVNSHGGINGHPVKISVADDTAGGAKAQG